VIGFWLLTKLSLLKANIFRECGGCLWIIHDTVQNGGKGIVLKLDYEKAYDRVSWQFLEEMLTSKGFGQRWTSCVLRLVRGGSISIKVNDENSPYFKLAKALGRVTPFHH
jgi:hypothetical protein